MKKLMIAAAASIAAVGAFAVESANVVGYNTITLPQGQEYGMYALPFDGMNEAATISIQELFKDPLTTFKGGSNAANADQIMFWYNGSYKNLYLFSTTATSSTALARKGKWINPSSVPDSSWGTVGQPSTLAIPGGTSFWIKRYIAAANKDGGELQNAALPELTVTVSGQVIAKASSKAGYTIAAATVDAPSYTLVAAGFSAPFIPNPDKVDSSKPAIDWIGMGCKGGSNAANADQLMFWYNGSYKNLYLFSTTSTAAAALARHNKWINPSSVPDSSWGTVGQPSTIQIQPTQGFWYLRQKGATTSFNFQIEQPYSL